MRQLQGSLILLFTSLIWGLGFVAQKLGMDYMPPFAFNGTRMLMGSIVLLPFIFYFSSRQKKLGVDKKPAKTLIKAGCICGLCLFVASNFQQVGLQYTTAGKAGFITAMYIVLVPVIGLFFGKRIRALMTISLVIAVIGLYFLCVKEGFSLNPGDGLVLLCAVAFSVHIISIDYFGEDVDSLKLSSLQFAICGSLSLVVSAFTEQTSLEEIYLAMPALLYAGCCSCGIAYTLQIVGQKRVPPTMASLLMSFESVFSVLGGAVILKDKLSIREVIGCILVFAAVIISQLPQKDTGK